jgi:acyl carrier protein
MITKNEILEVLFDCIGELNEVNGTELVKDANTKLVGTGSELDSMDFVQLIVNVEEKLESKHGVNVSITAEKAMSQKHSPFRTVETLADYILTLLQ